MDIFDWYFKQIVTQSQMDWAFDRVQNAMHGISLDTDMLGILDGLDPQQHAPTPDKNVDVVGPGVAYDPEGQRIYVADTLSVVDCSQDEFGTNTDPPTAGWWRYISIFVRFERDLTEPALDGNNVVVYTKQLEDAEFFVRIGAEAATGPGAVPPPLMNDAVLLVDILVQQGFTAILNTDMDFSRREDWVRFAGATIGDRVYGTSKEATEDMLALIDAWGGALPFTFTSTWFGAAPVLGPAPPPTTIQTALDAIVFDLAQAGPGPSGSDVIGVTDSGPFPFVTPWVAANLQSVLMSIATDLDNHIGGAPPQHPASAITFTPYGFIGATDVQAALQEVVDDLANGALPTLGAALVGFLTTAWTAAGWPVGAVGDVYGALNNIVQTLMGQGAGTAGANYLGTEPIAGSPESIGASYVMAVLTAIYGHLNDRTERASSELVSQRWYHDIKPLCLHNGLHVSGVLGGNYLPQVTYQDVLNRDASQDMDLPGVVLSGAYTDFARTARPLTAEGGTVWEPTLTGIQSASQIVIETFFRRIPPDTLFTLHDLSPQMTVGDQPLSCVADEAFFYLMCSDAGNVNTTVYCFDLATWTKQWQSTVAASCGPGGSTHYFSKIKLARSNYLIMCFGGEQLSGGQFLGSVPRTGGAIATGIGNAVGLNEFVTDLVYNEFADEIMFGVTGGTTQICSASVVTCGAGSDGPYTPSAGSGAPVAFACDGRRVWCVVDETASTGSLFMWEPSAALQANRGHGDMAALANADISNNAAAICHDGRKMWLGLVHDPSVAMPGTPARRMYVASFYGDQFVEMATPATTGVPFIPGIRHFVSREDYDQLLPTGLFVGRMLYHDGFLFTLYGWNNAAGAINAVPGPSLFKD